MTDAQQSEALAQARSQLAAMRAAVERLESSVGSAASSPLDSADAACAVLRRALQPFAALPIPIGGGTVHATISVKDIEAARAALDSEAGADLLRRMEQLEGVEALAERALALLDERLNG